MKCGHLKASDALPDHPSNALSGPLPHSVMRDFGPTGGRARCASSARGHMFFFSASGVVTVLAFVHSNLNASRNSSTVAADGSNSMTLATHPKILVWSASARGFGGAAPPPDAAADEDAPCTNRGNSSPVGAGVVPPPPKSSMSL